MLFFHLSPSETKLIASSLSLPVDLSFEPFDKASQDWRDIPTLQLHLDQCKLSFLDGQVQCFTKFTWRVDLEAPSSPDLSQAGKRPVDGVVVARMGEKRL